MQRANLEFLIEQATASAVKGGLPAAVRDSIEVGMVVPSILRKNLLAAGLKVVEDQPTMAKMGFSGLKTMQRTLVLDKSGSIVAMGASQDHDEALLHAMLGWFRENPTPGSTPPAGLASVKR